MPNDQLFYHSWVHLHTALARCHRTGNAWLRSVSASRTVWRSCQWQSSGPPYSWQIPAPRQTRLPPARIISWPVVCVITGEILFTLFYHFVGCAAIYLSCRSSRFFIFLHSEYFPCAQHEDVLGCGGIASIMHNLSTRWRWVIGVAPRLLCHRGKNHCYSSTRRLHSYFFTFVVYCTALL